MTNREHPDVTDMDRAEGIADDPRPPFDEPRCRMPEQYTRLDDLSPIEQIIRVMQHRPFIDPPILDTRASQVEQPPSTDPSATDKTEALQQEYTTHQATCMQC